MATFSTLDASQAPAPPKTSGRLTARMSRYEGFVREVKKGQVGKLTPADGETGRALALRISRAAKRIGKPVDAWVVDGVAYFRLA